MQASTQRKRKKKNHAGVKYMLTSLSIVATIGLWQHFSNKDDLAAVVNANAQADSSNKLIQFQPLPTLVPAQSANTLSGSGSSGSSENADGLRVVTAPTQQPVNQPRITMQQIVINNNSGATGSSPTIRTGSSRR